MTLALCLRQRETDGLNAWVSLSNGQTLCTSYSGCSVAVKFDDDEVVTYRGTGPAGGGLPMIFLNHETRVLERLRTAHRTIVEVPVYEYGRAQFTFDDVSGLDWPIPSAPHRRPAADLPAKPPL